MTHTLIEPANDSNLAIASARVLSLALDSQAVQEVVDAETALRLGREGPAHDDDEQWFEMQAQVYENVFDLAKTQLRVIAEDSQDDMRQPA